MKMQPGNDRIGLRKIPVVFICLGVHSSLSQKAEYTSHKPAASEVPDSHQSRYQSLSTLLNFTGSSGTRTFVFLPLYKFGPEGCIFSDKLIVHTTA
jgi:hypothetical protein